nr:MAG TPA_asm: hypothetical protein [Bacteriophage sp.]
MPQNRAVSPDPPRIAPGGPAGRWPPAAPPAAGPPRRGAPPPEWPAAWGPRPAPAAAAPGPAPPGLWWLRPPRPPERGLLRPCASFGLLSAGRSARHLILWALLAAAQVAALHLAGLFCRGAGLRGLHLHTAAVADVHLHGRSPPFRVRLVPRAGFTVPPRAGRARTAPAPPLGPFSGSAGCGTTAAAPAPPGWERRAGRPRSPPPSRRRPGFPIRIPGRSFRFTSLFRLFLPAGLLLKAVPYPGRMGVFRRGQQRPQAQLTARVVHRAKGPRLIFQVDHVPQHLPVGRQRGAGVHREQKLIVPVQAARRIPAQKVVGFKVGVAHLPVRRFGRVGHRLAGVGQQMPEHHLVQPGKGRVFHAALALQPASGLPGAELLCRAGHRAGIVLALIGVGNAQRALGPGVVVLQHHPLPAGVRLNVQHVDEGLLRRVFQPDDLQLPVGGLHPNALGQGDKAAALQNLLVDLGPQLFDGLLLVGHHIHIAGPQHRPKAPHVPLHHKGVVPGPVAGNAGLEQLPVRAGGQHGQPLAAGQGHVPQKRLVLLPAGRKLSPAAQRAHLRRFGRAASGAHRAGAGLIILVIRQGHIVHPGKQADAAPIVAVVGGVQGHQLLAGLPAAPKLRLLLRRSAHVPAPPAADGLLGVAGLKEQVIHVLHLAHPRLGDQAARVARAHRQRTQTAVEAALWVPFHLPHTAALNGHGSLLQVVQLGKIQALGLAAQKVLQPAGQLLILRVNGLHPRHGNGGVHLALDQLIHNVPHIAGKLARGLSGVGVGLHLAGALIQGLPLFHAGQLVGIGRPGQAQLLLPEGPPGLCCCGQLHRPLLLSFGGRAAVFLIQISPARLVCVFIVLPQVRLPIRQRRAQRPCGRLPAHTEVPQAVQIMGQVVGYFGVHVWVGLVLLHLLQAFPQPGAGPFVNGQGRAVRPGGQPLLHGSAAVRIGVGGLHQRKPRLPEQIRPAPAALLASGPQIRRGQILLHRLRAAPAQNARGRRADGLVRGIVFPVHPGVAPLIQRDPVNAQHIQAVIQRRHPAQWAFRRVFPVVAGPPHLGEVAAAPNAQRLLGAGGIFLAGAVLSQCCLGGLIPGRVPAGVGRPGQKQLFKAAVRVFIEPLKQAAPPDGGKPDHPAAGAVHQRQQAGPHLPVSGLKRPFVQQNQVRRKAAGSPGAGGKGPAYAGRPVRKPNGQVHPVLAEHRPLPALGGLPLGLDQPRHGPEDHPQPPHKLSGLVLRPGDAHHRAPRAAEQQAAGLRQGQPGHAQLTGFQHHHPAPGRHGLQRRALGRPQPEGLQQGLRLRALDVHIPLHIIKGVGRAAGIFVPVPVGFPQGFFFRLNVRLPAFRLPRRLFFFHGAGPARCPAPPFTRRSSASSFRLLVRPFFCAAGRRLFRRLRPSAMRTALRPGAKY